MENPKHKPILDYMYAVFDALDKTGANTDKYKSQLDHLTEAEFQVMMRDYIKNPKDHLTMEMDSFENNITLEDIGIAAGIAEVLVEDYLVLPHISGDNPDDPYVTNEKCMIGYANERRVQQTLSVKNHMSISIDKRNPKTGQVMDEDKNARISDMELYQLVFQNAHNTLAEFYGPRSDDLEMQNEMLYQIQRKGSVSLDELPNKVGNKTSLNYLNFLMLAAGYETDLISEDGLLPIVAERGGKLYKD